MTREEAIERLKSIWISDGVQEDYDALDMAIDTLKAIDDIKAEIRKLHPIKRGDNDYANGVYDGECWVIDKAMYIIDKYMREGKEVHCNHTDAEIADSFIEDVEAIKDQLPCGQTMDFPNTFDEFAEDYGFTDKEEIYTNGSKLITVFRVKQWLEHIKQEPKIGHWKEVGEEYIQVYDLNGIPSCGDERICSECGFETVFIGEHCSQYKFCPNCGAEMKEGEA